MSRIPNRATLADGRDGALRSWETRDGIGPGETIAQGKALI